MKCSRWGVALAVWCVTLAASWKALPAHAQAQQFVLVDVEYTATSANTMDSHYRVKPKDGIPANWRSPVNYANGKVYVELEVEEKPGNKNTYYNICIENNSNPACLPYMMYTATGKYKANFNFSDFWQYDMVDWTMGCTVVSLILKDETETKQQGSPDFYPYKAHVVLTVVPPGGTYVPPSMGGGAAGSPAAGSGGSAGKAGSGGMSASTAGKGGSGGSSATAAGKGGSGGMSASSGGKGGSGGSSATTAGKGGSGGSSSSSSGKAGSSGGAAGKSSSESGASGGSSAANGGSDGSAGTLSNQVGSDRSVSSQLESTGGCSTTGRSTTGASWFVLGLALLLRRRRSCN